jgi:hypothetical protein
MKRWLYLSLLAAPGLLAGCATISSNDLAHADYGPYPADYQSLITREAQARPETPAGAALVFGKPVPGVSHGLFAGSGTTYGYIVAVEIIRPHGSEAHTPSRLHYFMIADGRVTEITERFVVGHASYTGEMTD